MSQGTGQRRAPSQVPDLASLEQYARSLVASRDALLAMLPGLGVGAADIEDVSQDVLVAAWQSITSGHYLPTDTEHRPEAFKRWLHSIAWYTAQDYRKTAWKRRVRLASDPYALVGEPSAQSHEERVAAREALRMIERLPAWARDVLTYYYIEELDCGTIALIMGSLVNTTFNRLRLARLHFARVIKRWRRP